MRTRYFLDGNGRPSIKAKIYERSDHGISKASIDVDARKVCARLKSHNHEAYIVGGAVRDLLTGREPKDFDITTDAHPNRVKRIFRNSRIIGKRFRLAHIYFKDDKIHEVATYRSNATDDRSDVYGTLIEDVFRRDFTLNALYFDVEEEIIIDFIGGVNDIRKKTLRSVLPLESSFVEDPVRMLRAVKYAAITDMKISTPVGKSIKHNAALLVAVSDSRLSEELNKILKCPKTEAIFRLMDKYQLIASMLPNFDKAFQNPNDGTALKNDFFTSLAALDKNLIGEESERGAMVLYLTEKHVEASGLFGSSEPPEFDAVVRAVKSLLLPMIQPNRYVEEAVRAMFIDRNFPLPPRKSREKRGRKRIRNV